MIAPLENCPVPQVYFYFYVYRNLHMVGFLATASSPGKPGMCDSAMSCFRGWNREVD